MSTGATIDWIGRLPSQSFWQERLGCRGPGIGAHIGMALRLLMWRLVALPSAQVRSNDCRM